MELTSPTNTGTRQATSIVSSKGRSRATCRSRVPNQYKLVINLKTAKALGLDVPLALLSAPTNWSSDEAAPVHHRSKRHGSLAICGTRAAPAMPVIGFLAWAVTGARRLFDHGSIRPMSARTTSVHRMICGHGDRWSAPRYRGCCRSQSGTRQHVDRTPAPSL